MSVSKHIAFYRIAVQRKRIHCLFHRHPPWNNHDLYKSLPSGNHGKNTIVWSYVWSFYHAMAIKASIISGFSVFFQIIPNALTHSFPLGYNGTKTGRHSSPLYGGTTMKNYIISAGGVMNCHCVRLTRGDDLMESIRTVCEDKQIRAGVILSAAGCIHGGRIRAAGGITIHDLEGDYEIVSLTGTVSTERCHLHIALSGEDLQTIGGHLCTGCTVNTTCELVIGELPDIRLRKEADPDTGYNEVVFENL
jgi:predicted DNA-binding protein with PD1-like motif